MPLKKLSSAQKQKFKPEIWRSIKGPLKDVNFQNAQQECLAKLTLDYVSSSHCFIPLLRLFLNSHDLFLFVENEDKESGSGICANEGCDDKEEDSTR